jgi:hypothetical protein
VVARQQLAENGELVLARAAAQPRVIAGHFLDAQDVEVGEIARGLHDASRVDAAVAAARPLDVPGDELHGEAVTATRGASP